MCVSVPKGARNVIHKHHTTGANMPAHKLPPNFRRELNLGHWRMQNAHTRQSNRDSPTNTDPHPLTHTLLHSDLSSLSHPLTSHLFCPAPKKTHHHLPSCRKFLMISIISVCAVSPPSASTFTHAHNKHAHKAYK